MKHEVEELLSQAVEELRSMGVVPPEVNVDIQVERTRDPRHGAFATNLALVLAQQLGRKPRELAQLVCTALPPSPLLERVEVAGPGFVNFFVVPDAVRRVVAKILAEGRRYGRSERGGGRRVQVEFLTFFIAATPHIKLAQ